MKAKRALLIVLTVLLALSAAIALAACGGDPSETGTKYTVTYANGAADATGDTPASQSYEEGETFTLLPADTFTRAGYTFSSWSDGSNTYEAGATYTMPAHDVTFTAQWTADGSTPDDGEEDLPTLTELSADFYDSDNWVYMTNDDGESLDGGEVAYSLSDGSIKFHRANQAIEVGDLTNTTVSFMLKGTNDWSIWFNSSSIDNTVNSSYRLAYAYSGLRIALSTAPESAAAAIVNTDYEKGEWNRFDIVFSTEDGVCEIKVYVNGKRAELATSGSVEGVTVENNVMRHVQPEGFTTGNYMAVKVWEANNYVQLKPVSASENADVPVIACIGASITEGAGADNFYTESYPAQLQQALGNSYNVLNFGNSGKTVRTDLTENGSSVAWLDQPQWEGVQAVVPDIAIINMGTNDSKTSNDPATTSENFEAAYRNLLDLLWQVNPDMQIYICTVPYAYTDIWDINNDNIANIIAPVQRKLAQEISDKCTLIDLYEYSQNKSMLFGDGVHPNTTGYAMFVEIIKTALLEGGEALTDEFIADIDSRYNDVVSDFTATIEASGGQIELTVSGSTTLADGSSGVEIYVGTGEDNENYFPATVSGGRFSATIDFSELSFVSGWYNVRVYVYGEETNGAYDGSGYHILLMEETAYASGDTFTTDDVKVTLRTWSSNWGSTFSFTVGENYVVDLTDSVIAEVNGKLTLTVSGTTNDEGLQLYVGQHPTQEDVYRTYQNVTFGDNGAFSVAFDLTSMPVAPLGNNGSPEWYNVRLYFSDGTYFVVPLAETTDGTDALVSGDVFYCDTTKITIVTWTDGDVGTLSFQVAEYDGSFVPEVEITSAKIEETEGQVLLTVSGTTNDEGIRLYVGNDEDTAAYYHAITVTEGTFTISFDLASLEAGSGWYNVRIYYNEEFYLAGNTNYETVLYTDVVNGSNEEVQLDDVFYGTGKAVTIKTWGNYNLLSLLVEEYDETAASVTVQSVGFEDGYLVVSGTATGVDDLDIYLINTNVEGSLNNSVKAEIVDGTFTVRLSLATIAGFGQTNIPFNLRYTIEDGSTINVSPEELVQAQMCWFEGYGYLVGTNGDCVAVRYFDDVVIQSISFEDGEFVVTGMAGDAESLDIYLINTNVSASSDNYVSAELDEDGNFTVRLSLDTLIGFDQNNIPFNLRYVIDGGSTKTNIPQVNLDLTQTHTYNGYNFRLGTNNGCVAVYYTAG